MTMTNSSTNRETGLHRVETPEGAEKLCTSLLQTTADLISLLERETSLLRKAKVEDIAALHVRKQALSVTLTKNMCALKDNAEYIKSAAPERLDQLKEQQRQFQKSLEANHDALNAMKAVSEQLIHTIASKVSEKRGRTETYGKDAGLRTGTGNRPSAISVDTSL